MVLPGGIQVTAYESIHAIEPALWDALVDPAEVQSSHAFVRACEDAAIEDVHYRHLVIRRNGEPIGVASLFMMPVRLDLLSTGIVRTTVQRVRRLSERFLRPRVLFNGLPVSAGRPCLGARSAADLPDVLAAVSHAIDAFGREVDAHLHCVKEFSPVEAAALDRPLLERDFFRVPSLPSFAMVVSWASFGEYLDGMRAGYRRQVLACRHVARREGLTIRRVDDYEADCRRFFALYEQVMDRAQFQLERLNLAFFRNLPRELPGRTSAIFIERDGDMLAGAILLHTDERLTFFMAGIDYGPNRRCAAYLNLVAEVVAEAIRRRVGVLELGQTSAELKSRLGAASEDRFIYFRCPSRSAHIAFRSTASVFFPATPLARRRVFREPSMIAPVTTAAFAGNGHGH